MTAATISLLIEALVLVEGAGVERPDALNHREDAAGSLQIRPCIIKDLHAWGYKGWSLKDRYDPAQARSMARAYLTRCIRRAERRTRRPLTINEAARIWCAGPDGWAKSNAAIEVYAQRAGMYAAVLQHRAGNAQEQAGDEP